MESREAKLTRPLPTYNFVSLCNFSHVPLKPAIGISHCLCVYLMHIFYLWAHIAVDGQEDDSCFSCKSLMNRDNTKIFFTNNTDIRK